MSVDPAHSDASRDWALHEWTGSAADFHALEPGPGRAVWWCRVDAPAMILGSTQDPDVIDADAARTAGFDIVRRRSGGGLVPVDPDGSVWIDVTIPRDDPLWVEDVSRSMLWVGRAFVEALSPWVDAVVHDGAFEQGRDGRSVCFASTSPGEVFVDGSKLVGISQRRGRDGARMQCVLYKKWEPATWTGFLADPDVARRTLELRIATLDVEPADIAAAVLAALPR